VPLGLKLEALMITHKKEVAFMISTSTFDFLSPGKIHFEPGGSKKTGAMIKALGGSKVFLATDKGVLNANLLDGIVSSLKAEGLDYTVFDQIEPNPSLETVEKGFDLFKTQSCDSLVGFGGGSPIDTAKAIGVLTTNDPPIKQYEGAGKVINPVVPIVAVPTTAGTGSEVTGASVITDRSRNYKMSSEVRFWFLKLHFSIPRFSVHCRPTSSLRREWMHLSMRSNLLFPSTHSRLQKGSL
jgi:alcohol dehydrogenase